MVMNKKSARVGKLETIAFVSGFVLMVFELAGARILAPTIGSSTYVWTSVIGVIIAALSLGYWVGGKVADARGHMIDLARLCLAIAATIAYVLVIHMSFLAWVAESFDDPRIEGVVASFVLFAPTSFLLGVLSPYLAKLNVRSLKTSGSSIASLSALNSVGGIVGTFVAGFILFGYIGSRETFGLIAIIMLGLSWLIVPKIQWKLRTGLSAGVLFFAILPLETTYGLQIDTPTAHYTVFETQRDGKKMRGIATGPGATQSGIFPDDPDSLVFWYTQQLDKAIASAPHKKSILVLGGGTFTLPQHLAYKYPDSSIDVVEIDPKLADISRQHFNYKDPANVQLIFDDARTYVNQATKQYDIIVVDVYGDTHVPFSMITREYGDRINALLTPDGVVAVNMIAGLDGGCNILLNALDAPYRAQFPNASYAIQDDQAAYGNVVVSYSRQPHSWEGAKPLVLETYILYDDNRAPAELLQYDCRRKQ
jgi:predicted membrane-bound spermidine synthase